MKNRVDLGLILLGLILIIPGKGLCQEAPLLGAQELKTKIDSFVQKITAARAKGGASVKTETDTALQQALPDLIPFILIGKSRKEYVEAIEEARLDKQVGAGDTNSGSTSLVSKGSVPAILGFAVENGALKREQSGTTFTFRGNPVGIIKALGDRGFIESYDDDVSPIKELRRLSFAVSFDVERGSIPGTFVGDLKQLSSYSVRFDIYNKRDPRNSGARSKWQEMIRRSGTEMVALITTINNYFLLPVRPGGDARFQEWYADTKRAVAEAAQSKLKDVLTAKLKELNTLPLPEDLAQAVQRFDAAVEIFLSARAKLLNEVANGAIFTSEYTNTRQMNLPDLSNFRLIYENGFNGRADLTANGSITIFNSKPTGAASNRLRDFQLSSQLDIPLSNPLKSGNFVLSFSGKFQRMVENTTTSTGGVLETKGNIGIGQIKLTIPVKGSGVKVPISVTFANRTELIKEKEVRANFGFTFDLDAIFAKSRP